MNKLDKSTKFEQNDDSNDNAEYNQGVSQRITDDSSKD